MLHSRVGGGINVDVGVASDDHWMPFTEAAHCPAQGKQPACGPWTLMRVTLVHADFQGCGLLGDESCEAQHLVLSHVPAADCGEEAPPRELEVEPVSARWLLKKGVYHLSLSAGATCISCSQVAISVSCSIITNPPSWGGMPLMRCSLCVQAACPRRGWIVSRR